MTTTDPALTIPDLELTSRLLLDLTVRRDGLHLAVAGTLDVRGAARLRRALQVLEYSPRTAHLHIHPMAVVDPGGLEPIVDSIRSRRTLGLPPLRLRGADSALQQVVGLGAEGPAGSSASLCVAGD